MKVSHFLAGIANSNGHPPERSEAPTNERILAQGGFSAFLPIEFLGPPRLHTAHWGLYTIRPGASGSSSFLHRGHTLADDVRLDQIGPPVALVSLLDRKSWNRQHQATSFITRNGAWS